MAVAAAPPPLAPRLGHPVRTCEGLVDVFLILYALEVVGITAPAYGVPIGVQAVTAIASYLPGARLADRLGRKPFVIATFVAFAAFPVTVVLAHGFAALNLVRPSLRARSIGLYYLVRSLAIAPAALVGGLLWTVTPALPFWTAGALGIVGVVVFAATVEER